AVAPAQATSRGRHQQASSSRRVWPSISPLRSQGAGRFKIRLGVERRHAAGPGGSHRLPVDVIGDVARGKYPGDRRRRRVAFAAAFYLDVTADHAELTFEELRIRRMSDRDENTMHVDVRHRTRPHIFEAGAVDAGGVAENLVP